MRVFITSAIIRLCLGL